MFTDKLPAFEGVTTSTIVRDNLNARHLARQQHVKGESCERLRRALRHNVRTTDIEDLNNGQEVYYKRNDSNEWRGPGIVIGRDGKQILVRHGGLGGVYVRVHVCRLRKAPEGKII